MVSERKSVGRLRRASAIGALAIVGVLVIQVVILITLSIATLPPSRSTNASGLRGAMTLRILYDATVHDQGDRTRVTAALTASEANFSDFNASELALFQRFIAHPTRVDAFALINLYNAKTSAYEASARASRQRFRYAAIGSSIIAIAIVFLLYFRLARPAESRWVRLVVRLEESQQRFSSMFDYHPDAIALIDEQGRIVQANEALERISLYRANELAGLPLDALAPAPDAMEHAGLGQVLFVDSSMGFDAALRNRSGASLMVHVDTVPMRVAAKLCGVYVIIRDVTHERELEFRERLQRERLRALAHIASLHAGSVDRQISETLQFAVRSLDVDGSTIARVHDDKVEVVHGTGEGVVIGSVVPFAETYTRLIFGTNKLLTFWDREHNDLANDPAQQRFGWSALIMTTAFADGVPVATVGFNSMASRRRPFEEADLDFVRVVAAMIGAALAREDREEELEKIAYVDAVTRLPNRRYGMDQLRLAIARAERSGESVIAYFIDLDGFKAVNDEFGHAVGDEFLAITSARLRAVLREGDVLARVGGDEFLAMQITSRDDTSVLRLGERLIEAASEPAIFDGRAVKVGASVGIASYPRDARTADELLEQADQAMYASKRAGKGVATLA